LNKENPREKFTIVFNFIGRNMKTFKTQFRVRYAETDAAEVAYYGSFFLYFEVGKIEMYRELGLPYKWDIPIVDTYCKYLAPKEDDGELEPVAQGYTTHVFIDKDRKAISMPKQYIDMLERIENEE
jgi:acyl-CoA thioesterase FadM